VPNHVVCDRLKGPAGRVALQLAARDAASSPINIMGRVPSRALERSAPGKASRPLDIGDRARTPGRRIPPNQNLNVAVP
jgi:hypothetical protein